MKGLTVSIQNWDKHFLILDTIIEDGNTRYIGHFLGETYVRVVSPCVIERIILPRKLAK